MMKGESLEISQTARDTLLVVAVERLEISQTAQVRIEGLLLSEIH